MKTKLIKKDDEYYVAIPAEFIEKLHYQENDALNISMNLELTQIIIGNKDEQNIQDIEADEDF